MDVRARWMLYGLGISLLWLSMAWYCASIAADYVKIQRYQWERVSTMGWTIVDRLTGHTRGCTITRTRTECEDWR